MSTTIRFPPPPPTRNELSSEQRARLMRSNSKLGQVLGSTPHVLDLSYVVTKTPVPPPSPPKTPTSSRNPFKLHGRSKSVTKVDMDSIRVVTQSPDSVSSSTTSSSHRSTTSVRIKTDELAWRTPYTSRRPPLLKLAVPSSSRKPSLATIPGSPPYDHASFDSLNLRPPSFRLPSESALRREKLRRVRKMLGDGVPTDLIFPSSAEESDSDGEDSPLIVTPTSVASREWLLVDVNKPLPTEPATPAPEPRVRSASPVMLAPGFEAVELQTILADRARRTWEPATRRNKLYREHSKERPSGGAQRLESIAESAKESRPSSVQVLGVSASAGMNGRGRSRRFIEGEVMFDQIAATWNRGW